ncbi:hypothetical protein L6452_27653 [Arctium lappa]|uniref:Uncharacterized protein n=1 Tax=Arctium lappa TaxID=4217 RepID=A0ACB8ZX37_ARCLA|nr:hypothetical protein L6452_27653 [Arctium lappa]
MGENGENARRRGLDFKFFFVSNHYKNYSMLSKKSNPEPVRRPSARIMMKTAFSRFVNTPDDPVCLDGVTPTEEARKDDEQSSRKKSDDKQQAKGKEVEEGMTIVNNMKQLCECMRERSFQSTFDLYEILKTSIICELYERVSSSVFGLNDQTITRGRLSGEKRKDAENQKLEEMRASKQVRTKSRTSEKLKGKGKACMNPDANNDSDFKEPRFSKVGIKIDEAGVSGARKKEQKKKGKAKKVNPQRPVLGIRTRTSPMILQQTLYELSDDQKVASTVCDIKDLPNGIPPLRRWSMDHLRQRLATGIKEGGLQMAKLKHLPALMPRPIHQTQPEDVPSTSETPCDIDSVKKIFPDETLFVRYEDELATLFNEHGLGGSSEKKANTVQIREEYGGKTNPPKDGTQTPSVQDGGPLL